MDSGLTWRRFSAGTAPASLLANAPLLERIAEDPILRDVKIIAEAWDAAGAYEVGSFSERRWAEWNGRYRDDVRRFWRGDDGMLGLFASRICGSADIYTKSGQRPRGQHQLRHLPRRLHSERPGELSLQAQ
jgi:pullulanase/glycogen debranching enzyme